MTALELADVRCSFCEAPVGPHFNEAAAVVRCACGKVLDLAPFVLARRQANAETPLVARPEAVEPLGVGVFRVTSGHRLDSPTIASGIGGLLMLFMLAFIQLERAGAPTVGVAIMLSAMVSLLVLLGASRNVRLLKVEGDRVRVWWTPVPWFGASVDLSRVQQFVVQEANAHLTRERIDRVWHLIAQTKEGDVRLFIALRDPMVAVFLQQELERLRAAARKEGR